MALYTGIRHSRVISSFKSILNTHSSQIHYKRGISGYILKHENNNGSSNEGSSQEINWKLAYKFGVAVGLTTLALNNTSPTKDLLADEKDEIDVTQEMIDKENR